MSARTVICRFDYSRRQLKAGKVWGPRSRRRHVLDTVTGPFWLHCKFIVVNGEHWLRSQTTLPPLITSVPVFALAVKRCSVRLTSLVEPRWVLTLRDRSQWNSNGTRRWSSKGWNGRTDRDNVILRAGISNCSSFVLAIHQSWACPFATLTVVRPKTFCNYLSSNKLLQANTNNHHHQRTYHWIINAIKLIINNIGSL